MKVNHLSIVKMCRCCLATTGNLTAKAFDKDAKAEMAHLTKAKYIFREVLFEESQPFLFCDDCIQTLNISYKFMKTVFKENATFQEKIKELRSTKRIACRCCLAEQKKQVGEDTSKENLNKLLWCFHILNQSACIETYGQPFHFCKECMEKLISSFNLKRTVVLSNCTFKNYLKQLQNCLTNFKWSRIAIEVKGDEILQIAEDEQLDTSDEMTNEDIAIKDEPSKMDVDEKGIETDWDNIPVKEESQNIDIEENWEIETDVKPDVSALKETKCELSSTLDEIAIKNES